MVGESEELSDFEGKGLLLVLAFLVFVGVVILIVIPILAAVGVLG